MVFDKAIESIAIGDFADNRSGIGIEQEFIGVTT